MCVYGHMYVDRTFFFRFLCAELPATFSSLTFVTPCIVGNTRIGLTIYTPKDVKRVVMASNKKQAN